jgi:hypothetical protein
MRLTLYTSLFLGLLMADLNADIIDAALTPTGLDSIQYSFTLSGFNLLQYQVLDLKFDSSTYSSLSNALAPSNFSTTILQPFSPTPGDFLVEALKPNLTLPPGSVSIDATLTKGHGALGPLTFQVYQFDSTGNNNGAVQGGSGTTSDPAVPEPAGDSLVALTLVVVCILGRCWRNRVNPLNRGYRS